MPKKILLSILLVALGAGAATLFFMARGPVIFCGETIAQYATRKAVETGDIGYCAKLKDIAKAECEANVAAIAEAKKRDEQEKSWRETADKAAETMDPKLCDSITDGNWKSICASQAQNAQLQKEGETVDKKVDEAYAAKNSALCDGLPQPEQQLRCYLQYDERLAFDIVKEAAGTRDTAKCDTIKNPEIKGYCVKIVDNRKNAAR